MVETLNGIKQISVTTLETQNSPRLTQSIRE
jgi:hypothetical protein